MQKLRNPYNIFQKAGAVFLIATLIWLTISSPFILSAQQNSNGDEITNNWCDSTSEEDDCPGNNIDEKAPSGTNLAEEFLHDQHITHCSFITAGIEHGLENAGLYIAFHGELHAPPPNVA